MANPHLEPITFTGKFHIIPPVIPQVELPPYKVFFPGYRHPYLLDIRRRYYESHNYLCKELSPEKEFAFICLLQQYLPPRDPRYYEHGFKYQGHLGLLPHEKEQELSNE